MLDFFFLSEEQVVGNNRLSIFKRCPEILMAPVTDYSLLLGGNCFGRKIKFTVEGKELFGGKIKAGNDAVLGVEEDYIDVVEKAVLSGEIEESRIDDACRRILDMKEKLGFFSDENEELEDIEKLNEETLMLARKVCEKGVTIECNKGKLLPLDKSKIKSVGIVAITPDKNIVKTLEKGIGASFEKRGIKTTIVRNLYSYDEIKKISDENDLIIYLGARVGKFKYFGMEERESYNFVLRYGALKSMGVSLGDPYICFDEFSIIDTFINAYNVTNEAQEAVVQAILGEIPLNNTGAFNIVPKEFREYEKMEW